MSGPVRQERGVIARSVARLSVRAARARAGTRGLAALGGLAVAAAGLMAVDALAPLPAWARGLATLGWLGAAGWAFIGAGRALRGAPIGSAARTIEERAGLERNEILSAAQLEAAASASHGAEATEDAVAAQLRARAVERAQRILGTLPPTLLVRRGAWRGAAGWLGAGVVALLGAALVFPGLMAQEWTRLARPWVDHPAYTRLRFAIGFEPARAMLGQDVTAHVTIEGGVPGAAWVDLAWSSGARVADQEAGAALRLAVEGADEGADLVAGGAAVLAGRATLQNVSPGARVRVRTDRGTSPWVSVPVEEQLGLVEGRVRVSGGGAAAREVDLTPGREVALGQVLEGSTVELRAVYSGLVLEAGLRASGAASAGTGEVNGRVARASAVLEGQGEAVLESWARADGGYAAESVRVRATVVRDEPPIVEPEGTAALEWMAVGGSRRLGARARDDGGVESVHLAWVHRDARGRVVSQGVERAEASGGVAGAVGGEPGAFEASLEAGAQRARAGDRFDVAWLVRDGRTPSRGGGQVARAEGPRLEVARGDAGEDGSGSGRSAQVDVTEGEDGAGEGAGERSAAAGAESERGGAAEEPALPGDRPAPGLGTGVMRAGDRGDAEGADRPRARLAERYRELIERTFRLAEERPSGEERR